MANIKLISLDITGDKELTALLNEFSKQVTLKDKTKETRSLEKQLLDASEELLGARLNAKVQRGKLGQAETADFRLPITSPIVKLLYGDAAKKKEFESTRFEFKASTEGSVTIGQLTIGGRAKEFAVPGTKETLTTEELYKKLGISGEGYLLDLDPRAKGPDITDLVFDEYFKDKRLESIFFSKSRNMVLSATTETDGSKTNRLAFISFPKKYFTKEFFKATREDKAIVLSIKTSFQNYIKETLNQSHISAIKRIRPIKKTFSAGNKQYTIDFLSRNLLDGSLNYGFEITNSVKARPVDTYFIKTPPLKAPKEKKESKQAFISGVQWTVLTQKRLGETMLRLGEPEPPELKERSGRFRGSVQVFANYRTMTLQYLYNPLYASLKRYGYRPDLQIETAIREVAQSLYAQKFNILRSSPSL